MPPTHSSLADVAAAYRTLIAHETEPKEQDFYRTRLQRLEQATEPECEFDCRNRVAAAGVGVYCPQCSAKCADTDLATQLAKAIRAAWVDRLDWDELAQGALEFLTSTGRLLAADGLVLAGAEKAALERLLAAQTGIVSRDVYEAIECLRALFPATEPAKVNGNICTERNSSTLVDEGRESGGQMDRYTCIPAPAEPAEEETKAEYPRSDGDFTVLGPEIFTDASGEFICWKGVNYVRQPDPASSPVVPAPTETESWPSIEKVPTGLVVIGTNGERFMGCPCESETHGYANQFAPFVAMKER
ncbi:hypothetical protein ACWGK5_32205 [Rhodococcus qingshengii]